MPPAKMKTLSFVYIREYIFLGRIKKMKESLFNAKNLQPVMSKAKVHCTCKKVAGSFPYGKPESICNVTAAMTPCREQNLPSSVFAGRCKSVTHERRKREASVITDEEQEQYPLELNDSNPVVVVYYTIKFKFNGFFPNIKKLSIWKLGRFEIICEQIN